MLNKLSLSKQLSDSTLSIENYWMDQYLQQRDEIRLETIAQVKALKVAIETHGLSPGLLSYADAGGALTQAAQIRDISALESLNLDERKKEEAKILTALDLFLAEEDYTLTLSQEGWRDILDRRKTAIAALVSVVLGVASRNVGVAFATGVISTVTLHLVNKIVNSEHALGTASEINDLLKQFSIAVSLIKKIVKFPTPTPYQKDIIYDHIKTLIPECHQIGIYITETGREVSSHPTTPNLTLTPFTKSGITKELYVKIIEDYHQMSNAVNESGVKQLAEHLESMYEINEVNSNSSASSRSDFEDQVDVFYNVSFYVLEVLKKCQRELYMAIKKNAKFFSTKPQDTSDNSK